MAQTRRSGTDDDVALHPMARRHVVAAVLLCAGFLTLLWPAPRGANSSFHPACELRDRSASDAVARLIQDRQEAAEARINDAVLSLPRTRENCR